jgi:hypothetical protein
MKYLGMFGDYPIFGNPSTKIEEKKFKYTSFCKKFDIPEKQHK